jgi:parvulin-like peptidyl-prolyl isomerase
LVDSPRSALTLFAWISVSAAIAGAEPKVVERISAVINDEIILLSELEQRVRVVGSESPMANVERLRRDVLNHMIDERLIAQEATTLKLQVDRAEVDRAVDEVKRQNRITHAELEEALGAQGMTMSSYRSDLRNQILRLKVINLQVRSRVTVSDEDVRKAYEQNLRTTGTDVKVRVRQLLVAIPPDSPRAVREARRAQAVALGERVRAGEDLAELARELSDDPSTRADGGDLGYVTRSVLPPEVAEVVFEMKVGELRGPVYSDQGAHIVRVLDRKASEARPFEEIKGELRRQIHQQEVEKQTKLWLVDVRKRAHVDVRL